MKNKIKNIFFFISVVFKTILAFLLTFFYLINELYLFSTIYFFLNIFVLYFLYKERKKSIEFTLIFAIIIDLLYSLIINFTFADKIKSLFYFYPGTFSLYSLAIDIFTKNQIINFIIIIYGIILLLHSAYLMRNKFTLFNISFLNLFLFLIGTVTFKLFLKD